ncbi:hypothetical protein ACQCT3_02245 [Sutcliffiella horikoshii]|uniref:hypothetical protein n=1 Tax=Sutcliffiella horikoshii TaxID=79883 RepID=UPI003CF07B48
MKDATRDNEAFAEMVRQIVLKVLDEIEEKSNTPKSVDEKARLFSDVADEIILQAIKKEHLTYISGKLKVQQSQNQGFYTVVMDAYFQKENGEWVVKSSKSSDLPLSSLTKESQAELEKKKTIEYEIEEPKAKTKN